MTSVTVNDSSQFVNTLTVHALPQRYFTAPNERSHFTAHALNGLGQVAVGTTLRWSMADPKAGTIDEKGSFISGEDPGVYADAVLVEAFIPGEFGFVHCRDYATVVVQQSKAISRLKSVEVRPTGVVLQPGTLTTFSVKAAATNGKAATNLVIAWEMVDGSAGEISSNGAFKAGSMAGIYTDAVRVSVTQKLAGGETITMTKTGTITIPGKLTTVDIQPLNAVVSAGKTVRFSVKGWDENSVEVSSVIVRWSLADNSIGTINGLGNFKASASTGKYENAIIAEIVQIQPAR